MNTAAVVAFQSPFDGLIDEAAGTSTPGPTRKNDSKFYIRMRRFGERSVDSLPALTPVASTTSQPVIRTFPTTGLKYAKETVIPSRPRDDGATPVPVSSPSLHLGVVVSVDTFHGVLRPHGLQSRTESVRCLTCCLNVLFPLFNPNMFSVCLLSSESCLCCVKQLAMLVWVI